MPDATPNDLDALAFLELLWALDHGLNRVSKQMLKTLGVTGPQRTVIRLIGRDPDTSAGEIAERAHHHPSTLSVILRSLERNGHVLRSVDADDKRRVRLRLSPAGRRVNQNQKGTVEAAVRRTLDRLDRQEIAVIAKGLELLVEELERSADGAG